MAMYALTLFLLVAAVALIVGALHWTLTSVGLQEADDPNESSPEDLTDYEKRHTERSDVHA